MVFPDETDFSAVLTRVASEFTRHDLPLMVIGGQAVLVHGEPRLTQDIDLTVGVAPHRLPEVLEACRQAELVPLPEHVDASSGKRSCFRSATVRRGHGWT